MVNLISLEAYFENFRQLCEAEELEATAIGQDRPLPTTELMESTEFGNHPFARAKGKMVGVAQDHLSTGSSNTVNGQTYDRAKRSDRHESGQLDGPMRRMEDTPPGRAVRVLVQSFETKGRRIHPRLVATQLQVEL